MRFTEHELTTALTGAAKTVLASQRKDIRKGRVDVETAWEALDRYQRFKLLDALGTEILPVMVALPDVQVEPGTKPSFTDAQISDAVEARMGEERGILRRRAKLFATVSLVRTTLDHLPPRNDPDALTVPDSP